jgi:hypothetical protein
MKNTRGHVAFLALTALALAIVFFWSPSDVERVKEAEAADARTAAMGAAPMLSILPMTPFWERFERENAGGALSELPPQF